MDFKGGVQLFFKWSAYMHLGKIISPMRAGGEIGENFPWQSFDVYVRYMSKINVNALSLWSN